MWKSKKKLAKEDKRTSRDLCNEATFLLILKGSGEHNVQ
jgi:hypothetical protein